jgi:sugar lactone lactonase YvrE
MLSVCPQSNSAMRFLSALPLCCLLLAVNPVWAATPKAITVAGGFIGDGGLATSASLNLPASVVADANGNTYISDASNCRIRRVTRQNVITTIAGTGICGYSGDGGPASTAKVNFPGGFAIDLSGNLLFADMANNRIRKISPAGNITTIIGNGVFGYSGDGGPAKKASLANPKDIFLDPSGNLYIADGSNFVIRRVDTAGIIHTIAGNHTQGFSGDNGPATLAQIGFPNGVVADAQGNFYISDSNNRRIRKVDSVGTITTYAGNGMFGNGGNGGPATAASIGQPQGLLLAKGKLFFGTSSNIWAVGLTTQIIHIFAGNGNGNSGFSGDGQPALATTLDLVRGISITKGGALLFVDANNGRVRKIASNQIVSTIAGGYIGDGGSALAASVNLSCLCGNLGFDHAGNLYIAEGVNQRVRKISSNGTITTIAGTGLTGYSGDGGPATAAMLNTPNSVAVDGNGNIYIGDTGNIAIRKVDSAGIISTFATNVDAQGLAVDAFNNVYAAAPFSMNVILEITPGGVVSTVAGVAFQYGYNGDGIPATQAHLFFPTGVAVDSAGNLYIADWLNARVRKVDTAGIISTVAGNGIFGFSGDGGLATAAELSSPIDVAVDARGNLYIADAFNFRVRIVDPTGIIQTFAGTGNVGFNGNGLPATRTNMLPISVAVSSQGVPYISDEDSNRVRKVQQ